jgi:WD40 repeat protein
MPTTSTGNTKTSTGRSTTADAAPTSNGRSTATNGNGNAANGHATPTNRITKQVYLEKLNKFATFLDRQAMKVGHPTAQLIRPANLPAPPALPIDWAKSLNFPIDGNDIYGDCMMAAAEHADNTFTGNTGTESTFNQSLTVTDYLQLSGGNNGLNTGQIIGFWENGLPGIPAAKIMDALSIDTTDASLVQLAIYLFGGVFFTLNIPDNWYHGFFTGDVWDAPATADGNNGHGVWWNGVNTQGQYHLQTWGTYGWITPAGVKDCDPGGFVVFSTRWFNAQGIAPNGKSYSDLASLWQQMGGQQLPLWPAAPSHKDQLLPGQGLQPGQSIQSADGRFNFIMQGDGNLVLYGPGSQALWASNTNNHPDIFDCIMQPDGNLVLYCGKNNALWSSGTAGKNGSRLIVQNDGNVVLYNPANQAVWATNTVVPAQPASPTQADRLLAGQGLIPGRSIKSSDGRFTLIMQADGNLVVYGPRNQALWASGTNGHGNVWDAVMQGDGNFVVYDGHNHPLWATGTNGKGGAAVVMQSDGNLVVYDASNRPLWASNTVVPAQPAAPTQTGRLLAGQGLLPGGSIKSADGRFTLIMQGDGNLVLYGPGNQALWATGTQGHNNVWDVIMQGDGNLVIYDAHNHPLWATGTNGKQGVSLTVQNDGNVVLYDSGNHAVWASNTVVPVEPAAPAAGGKLLPGQGLIPGRSIKSADGRFTFILQQDGNLVLYDPYNQALWSSGTNGHGNVWDLVMQSDGNLVIYDGHNHPIWASNTAGKPGATLTAQTDGNVVIYDTNNHAVWATNTEVGVEILKG